MAKKKVVFIHPAIAPYRIDFFNSINKDFNAAFYFEFGDALEQSFDQNRLKEKLTFTPHYLKPGFKGVKNLRLDIFKILRREKPSVVFCGDYTILSFLIVLYKIIFNWKLHIYSICDDSFEVARNCKGVRRFMRTILLYCFTGIIISDKRALDWYENLSHSARLIYFPIIQQNDIFRKNLAEAIPVSQRFEIELSLKKKKIILYVGRLAEVKNLFFLLSVFKEISKSCKDLALVIVGDGLLQDELISRATEYQLQESVFFVGKHEGAELLAWYNIGDVFVLPSYFEPFGTVVNEALLAGCYTFCSLSAGAACLIEEPVNGQLFDPYDEPELVRKVSDYLNSIQAKNQLSLRSDKMPVDFIEAFARFVKEIR